MSDDFELYSEEAGDYLMPFGFVGEQLLPFAIGADDAGYFIGPSIIKWDDYLQGIESLVLRRDDGLVVSSA